MKHRNRLAALMLVLAACGGSDHKDPLKAEYRAACTSMAGRTISGSEKLVEGKDGWIPIPL